MKKKNLKKRKNNSEKGDQKEVGKQMNGLFVQRA